MGVFGGGLLSIPIVLAILIFGLKQDPLKIAPSMAKWPIVGGLYRRSFSLERRDRQSSRVGHLSMIWDRLVPKRLRCQPTNQSPRMICRKAVT